MAYESFDAVHDLDAAQNVTLARDLIDANGESFYNREGAVIVHAANAVEVTFQDRYYRLVGEEDYASAGFDVTNDRGPGLPGGPAIITVITNLGGADDTLTFTGTTVGGATITAAILVPAASTADDIIVIPFAEIVKDITGVAGVTNLTSGTVEYAIGSKTVLTGTGINATFTVEGIAGSPLPIPSGARYVSVKNLDAGALTMTILSSGERVVGPHALPTQSGRSDLS